MKQKDEATGAKIAAGLREASTPWAGASLLVELFGRSGIDATANKVLASKGSAKGLKRGQTVESFVVPSAPGGDYIEDVQHLRDIEAIHPGWDVTLDVDVQRRVKVCSDSAAYQQQCLERRHNRGSEFAISADISQALKREVDKLPYDAWHLWRIEKDGVINEWADIPYVPAWHYERKDSYPY
jgi:hypothetical protein